MLAPFLIALAENGRAAGAYGFSACATMLVGAGVYMLSAGWRRRTDFRSALLVVLLWWAGAPVFAALPLCLTGLGYFDAYFEAVSALTTTGAWLSREGVYADAAGAVWRAELQWLGGLASMSIAAAIFIRPAFMGVDTLLPPFSRGDRDSDLRALRSAVAAFYRAYAIITFVCFLLLLAAGAEVLDAAVMAMSAMASGGMIPHTDGLSGYAAAVSGVLFAFILLSGANFILVARLFQGGRRQMRDVETGVYVLMVLMVGVLLWLTSGAGDLDLAPAQIFNAASLLSTSGVLIGREPALTVALITAIIGGAAVSTAGGFKVLRWLVIMRRGREELRRLISPSAVFGVSRVADELGVWMHFLMFTMTLAALLLAATAAGYAFETAATAATAVLSNTGPLLALAEGGGEDYAIFDGPLRALFIVGMILGRLEAVVALALVNRAFWRS
ncbi:MAG: Trk system potassium transporter TrkH [Amphiplicatus sp.]